MARAFPSYTLKELKASVGSETGETRAKMEAEIKAREAGISVAKVTPQVGAAVKGATPFAIRKGDSTEWHSRVDSVVEGVTKVAERVDALEKAKRDGESFAKGGKDRSDCPHPPGHVLGKAWRAGFDSVVRKDADGNDVTALRKRAEEAEKLYREHSAVKPHKPSPESRAFGSRGKSAASPEAVARWEAEGKAYSAWNRKYLKLAKENTEAANALYRTTRKDAREGETLITEHGHPMKKVGGGLVGKWEDR